MLLHGPIRFAKNSSFPMQAIQALIPRVMSTNFTKRIGKFSLSKLDKLKTNLHSLINYRVKGSRRQFKTLQFLLSLVAL